MNFQRLTLTDFGIYAGTQHIDLAPLDARPITLIGGTNGSGKTTVLEALLFCLHGRRAVGAVSDREYEDHLRSRIHVPPSEDRSRTGRVAGVRLAFSYVEAGLPVTFEVERSWRRTHGGRLHEDVTLVRDGEEQEDVTGIQTQTFLDGVMPPGLAGLFLFDGEKIQRLADDDSGHHLHDAVRRLLGLDLLERLETDLRRYIIRPAAQRAGQAAADRFKAARAAVEAAEGELARRRTAYDQAIAQRNAAEQERVVVREQFDAEGGALAQQRAALERRLAKANKRAAVADARLRDLVAGALPLTIVPALGRSLATRLEDERRLEEDEAVRRRIEAAASELAARLRVRSRTAEDPVAVLRDLLAPDDDRHAPVHDVSRAERARMQAQLAALARSQEAARDAAKQLRRARADAQALAEVLDTIPDDADVAPLLGRLRNLALRIAELDHVLRGLDEELRSAQHTAAKTRRDLEHAEGAIHAERHGTERRDLAQRTITVLKAFDGAVAGQKMEAVELHTARYFNRLSRKGDLLGGVHIDRERFTIELQRWDGSILPKARLSAGERQLLAIALLWALATVAGHALPVVIDTPLARLDALHRHRLVTDYLPAVSHQVVVLSTDTEIDAATGRALAPFIAREYRLEHDREQCATTIVPGYFKEPAADAR